eukprot:6219856-Ditylum_brightwellii.AAC.1
MVIVDFWSLGDLPEFTQETNKARAAEKQGTTRSAQRENIDEKEVGFRRKYHAAITNCQEHHFHPHKQ